MGRECPPPQPTRGLGERCKLPSGVRGRAPTENEFWEYLELEKTHRCHKSVI